MHLPRRPCGDTAQEDGSGVGAAAAGGPVSGGASLRWPPVACGAVLPGHAGWNAAAALTARPCFFAEARISPERCRLDGAPPGFAGVLHIGRELLAERSAILGVQVDLIVGAFEGEPQGLRCRAAGQIVFQRDGYLLGRRYSLRWMMPAPYPGQCPPPSRNAADPGA